MQKVAHMLNSSTTFDEADSFEFFDLFPLLKNKYKSKIVVIVWLWVVSSHGLAGSSFYKNV